MRELTSNQAYDALVPKMAEKGFPMTEVGRLDIYAYLRHLQGEGFVTVEKRRLKPATQLFYLAAQKILDNEPPAPPMLAKKIGCFGAGTALLVLLLLSWLMPSGLFSQLSK